MTTPPRTRIRKANRKRPPEVPPPCVARPRRPRERLASEPARQLLTKQPARRWVRERERERERRERSNSRVDRHPLHRPLARRCITRQTATCSDTAPSAATAACSLSKAGPAICSRAVSFAANSGSASSRRAFGQPAGDWVQGEQRGRKGRECAESKVNPCLDTSSSHGLFAVWQTPRAMQSISAVVRTAGAGCATARRSARSAHPHGR